MNENKKPNIANAYFLKERWFIGQNGQERIYRLPVATWWAIDTLLYLAILGWEPESVRWN